MRSLISLDVADLGIADLTGLEHATEITWLAIPGNDIADLTPIAALTNLEALLMWWNPVEDLTPLSNLHQLRHIDANGCQISDLAPLAHLTNLTFLSLAGNNISDLRPLRLLIGLETLNLSANMISDISPLSAFHNLSHLSLQRNRIIDHSPVSGFSLSHYTYDEDCQVPPLPLKPRLESRDYPSIFSAWGGLGWSSVLNQPHLSDLEQMAQHDLYFCCLLFDQHYFNNGQQWIVRGDLADATTLRDQYLAQNPNMIFLVGIGMREASPGKYPDDSPYWVRDANGERVPGHPGTYLVNFTHPDVQEIIIQQAIAVSKCGLYDGIFFDWWHENFAILSDRRSGWAEGWIGFATEQRARDNIIKSIRNQTRPEFLIMVNTNRGKIPRTGPYINGLFMETGTPSTDSSVGGAEAIERGLREIEETLSWAEQNLMAPQINGLEGFGFSTEPMDSPRNLRWMRAITTLSLTHSDGYVLFNDGISHNHYWYDFWDAGLGRPIGAKAQLYEEIPGLYIREFTNGWAVYNHSGEAQVITLSLEAQGVASELVNMEHSLPNLDGEMYLRVKPKNPADLNGDGAVNILDLTLVAQAFGKDGLEADVNGDGVINVFDLVFVANQF